MRAHVYKILCNCEILYHVTLDRLLHERAPRRPTCRPRPYSTYHNTSSAHVQLAMAADAASMVIVVGTYESATVCLSFNPNAPDQNVVSNCVQL